MIPEAYEAISKMLEYQLEFLPKNELPDGSTIRIKFPDSPIMKVISGAYERKYLVSGLEDKDEFTEVVITIDAPNN